MLNRLLNSPVFAGTVVALIVGALLSGFLVVKIVGEIVSWDDNNDYPSRTITVNAEGEVLAVADIASFSFTVMESAESTSLAQQVATEKTNEAINFLKENGVEDKDIKTQSYNVSPKYDYGRTVCTAFDCPPPEGPKIVGYEVSQTVNVKVRQQEEAGRILTELGKIGISNVSGLSFTIDDEEVLYDKAREKAIENAKEKAEILANELGVSLENIVSFGEEGPMYYGQGYGMGEAKAMSLDSVSPQLPRGENSYTSKVWVTYEID